MRRAIVPTVFLAIAVAIGVRCGNAAAHALAHPGLHAALTAGYFALRTTVALLFAIFTLRRADPLQRARGALAYVACAVAMTAVLAFDPPGATTSSGFVLAGDLVAVVFCVWLVAAVCALGRCFGVLPEARGLVTRGPYRLVRHPVYLGEIGACAGLVLAAPSILNVGVLVPFVAAQAIRLRLEERALTSAFPGYARYAAQTPRLLPRLARSRSRPLDAIGAPTPSAPTA